MKEFANRTILCPHCGHYIVTQVDASNGEQNYYEDCSACCHSIHFKLVEDALHNKYELFVDGDDEQLF